MTALWLIAACRAATPATPQAASPTTPQASPPTHPDDVVFRGVCDASAAIYADDGTVWIADDEVGQLRQFARTGGDALKVADLGLAGGEADLEAGARIGDRFWWIGSHGRNKDGKPRPARQILLSTDATGAVTSRITTLLPALLAQPALAPVLGPAEPRAPKEGGISIEGLAASPEGGLWIGFRSPLSPDGRAPLVRLANPDAVAAGEPPVLTDVRWLDLGHRGIRSLEWDPGRKLWWISGGDPGTGGPGFSLFQWDGSARTPVAVEADLADMQVEALSVAPDGGVDAWSDDGTRQVNGVDCKLAPEGSRSFRGRRVVR